MIELPESPLDDLLDKMRTYEGELERELTCVRAMLAAAEGRDPGRTTELLLAVLVADPLRGDWPVRELADAITAQGWSTTSVDPVNAVRAALARLVEQGAVRRVDRGRYALAGAS